MKKLSTLLFLSALSTSLYAAGATATATATVGGAIKSGRSAFSRVIRGLFIFGTGYTLARNGNSENVETSAHNIITEARSNGLKAGTVFAAKEILTGTINVAANAMTRLNTAVQTEKNSSPKEHVLRTSHPTQFNEKEIHAEQHRIASEALKQAAFEDLEYDSEGKVIIPKSE